MSKELKKLTKNTIIFWVGIFLGKVVSFIMLPIYTRYLSPSEYGVLEMLEMMVDVVSMIVSVGILNTVFKYYYDSDNDFDKNMTISTTAITLVAVSLVTTVVAIIFSSYLSVAVFKSDRYSNYIKLYFIVFFFQVGMLNISMIYIRALQKSMFYVVLGLLKLVLQLTLNIYFVIVLKFGVIGVIYSSIISSGILSIYLAIYMFNIVRFNYSFRVSKKMVAFGFPFIFVTLSSFVLTFTDRYFLNYYCNLDYVGIYSLAYKFGFIMYAFSAYPFEQIWDPQRFEILKSADVMYVYKKAFLYLNLIVLSAFLIICLYVKDFIIIMSNYSYHEAYKLVPIILLAYVFQAWTFHCNIGIYAKDRTRDMALASIVSAVIVTILNIYLIPKYGMYGAAWATAGAFFLRFVFVYCISQKLYYIDYGWVKLLNVVIVIAIIYALRSVIITNSVKSSIGISSVLLIMYFGTIYKYVIEENEKIYLKGLINKYLA